MPINHWSRLHLLHRVLNHVGDREDVIKEFKLPYAGPFQGNCSEHVRSALGGSFDWKNASSSTWTDDEQKELMRVLDEDRIRSGATD